MLQEQNSINHKELDLELIQKVNLVFNQYRNEVGKAILGQHEAVELILISLLCNGHTLLHGLPGLGKTKLAATLSKVLGLDFSRVQFTPDLMPADITGTEIIEEDTETGKRVRAFMEGPIFTNLLLADEINRTPPKTQAALLEAMQEHQVTVGRNSFNLEEPFMVLATENPIEMEGTYTLPEAQLDRFMFSVNITYPSFDDEIAIVKGTTGFEEKEPQTIVDRDTIIQLQKIVRSVPVADDVINYAVGLVRHCRPEESGLEEVKKYVKYGASPRASQALILGAKAKALLAGRFYVNFEDVESVSHAVLGHRMVLNYRSKADDVTSHTLVDLLISRVSHK